MNKFILSTLCLAAVFAAPAQARDPSFVSAEQTHAMLLLATPPAADSAQTKAGLAELHRIEDARTTEQVRQAMADDKEESIFIFRNEMGAAFTAANLPLTAAFSARVKNDEGINTGPAKTGFARVRPYNQDKSLHPVCVTKTKDDSYPSGHATTGYLMALSLVEMVPEKRDLILGRAENYATNRMICGVHFRDDVQASKLLAYSIHAVMANNPQYQQEMAVARGELRQALNLPPLGN